MNIRAVISRNPLLFPIACVAALTVVLIGESSYWQSGGVLDELNAVRTGVISIQDLRATEDGQADIHRTLLLNRLGVMVLSVVSLAAFFLYLRQSLALEELRERDKQEHQRVVEIEHERLEVEVARRTTQLVKLAHHIETAREEERARLARDLHDEMGALLTSAKLDAARIKARLTGIAPEALERLAHLVETLNRGVALKCNIIENLRPSTLGTLGLVVTLEILAREFAKQSGIEMHCTLAPVRLEEAAELVVYRVVQEAFTNISKYARASQLWLNLSATNGQAELTVKDDGVGFDTGTATNSAYGLLGMRFRVEAEHGSLSVASSLNQGTLIRVRLPEIALA
ncbi:MAG: sensor histidine kinase [Burkholderiales bacterium]|jgi:signal transduction histidine kinase|nr:sensor histidine kinase [Burkholderiales bacterium]